MNENILTKVKEQQGRLQGAEGNCKTGWGGVLTNKGSDPLLAVEGEQTGSGDVDQGQPRFL